jgi:hypothetical protein
VDGPSAVGGLWAARALSPPSKQAGPLEQALGGGAKKRKKTNAYVWTLPLRRAATQDSDTATPRKKKDAHGGFRQGRNPQGERGAALGNWRSWRALDHSDGYSIHSLAHLTCCSDPSGAAGFESNPEQCVVFRQCLNPQGGSMEQGVDALCWRHASLDRQMPCWAV